MYIIKDMDFIVISRNLHTQWGERDKGETSFVWKTSEPDIKWLVPTSTWMRPQSILTLYPGLSLD